MDVEDVDNIEDVDKILNDQEKVDQLTEEEKEKLKKKILENWAEDNVSTPPVGYNQDQPTTQTQLYRAPVTAELQKFGSKDTKQLELFGPETEDTKVKVEGLDFSKPQDRAFNALQKLLDQTNYQGDQGVSPQTHYDHAREGMYKLPGILINYSDFYEAYGLERDKEGHYANRKQVKQAREALESLAEPWRITVERKKDNGKSDVVAKETSLIEKSEAYYDRDKEEVKRIKGGDPKRQADKILIRFKPLFIDKIEEEKGFYLFKPYNLLEEINEAVESNRYSRAIPIFIWWLNTINYGTKQYEDYDYEEDPHKIRKKELAYKLRLDTYIENRQWSTVDDRIEQACEVAQEIGFLLKYDLGDDMVKLWPNPARCSRLRYELKKRDKLPPELKADRL